jgi:hypothetical protein
LYKTSGHYRTGPHKVAPVVSSIWPAVMDQGGEVIPVCEDPDDPRCWAPPLTEPPTGGGDDSGPPGRGLGDGLPTKGGKPLPKRISAPEGSRNCKGKSTNDQNALNCESRNRSEPDPTDFVHRPLCTSTGEVKWCCKVRRVNNSYEHCQVIKPGPVIDLGGGIPIGGGIAF